ncbi:putative protein isoform X3 [Capsicum galapagoense]
MGEGTEEKLSSVVTSPCDPQGDNLLQGQSSSCIEKEFEQPGALKLPLCVGYGEGSDHEGVEKKLEQPGALKLPLCVGYGEGSDHEGVGKELEQPGALKMPLCVGPWEGSNHKGVGKGLEQSGAVKLPLCVGPGEGSNHEGVGKGLEQSDALKLPLCVGPGEGSDHKGVGKGLDLYDMDEREFTDSMDMDENSDKLFMSANSCESTEYKYNELVEKNGSLGVSGGSLEIKSMGIDDGLVFRNDVKTTGESFEGSSVAIDGDESETSSKYEHSDDEDSMYGGSTNDEKNSSSYYGRGAELSLEENDKDGNKLGMSSAIAFGSDDWDDFMQENGEFTLSSMVHHELQPENRSTVRSESECLNTATTVGIEYSSVGLSVPKEEGLPSNHDQAGDNLTNYLSTCSVDPLSLLNHGKSEHVEDENAMLITNNQIQCINGSAEFLEQSSAFKLFKQDKSPQTQIEEVPIKEDLKIEDGEWEVKHQGAYNEEVIRTHDDLVSGEVELKDRSLLFDSLSHPDKKECHSSTDPSKEVKLEVSTDRSSSTSSASMANDHTNAKSTSLSVGCSENHLASKTQNLELNELYDELVHDMEEILLESGESLGFSFGNRIYQSYIPLPSRDGGSTASTSGTDDADAVRQHPLRFDRVEVIGTRWKKGDVSLSERLVGAKEYTVYRIRVWSGKDNWEVEKRYREFSALYWRLKKLFADQGRILPPVWSCVEQESRKVFGSASPKVVADRSVLVQECLNSLLQSRFPTGALNAVVCFLSLSKDLPDSPTYDANVLQSPSTLRSRSLGKTISLIVNKRPYKSDKQLLDEQHYSCAGCYKNFDDGKTRIQELAQTMGWGKPRFCEYSGQLYCSSCHTNDMAVLPAKILHLWDFNQYPVSQMAKSYLDSIHDQPMLCVSAVNPLLFSKVPALQHVTNIRKRIGTMLPFVRCPFRRSIYKGVGSRRYLLESNDFFSLRDLIDLSKGVFAALPVMVETISRKILEHIAEQCLICCDVGIPCNARQACDDPSSLIFPFQEEEIDRCKSCRSVFHKHCFRRISSCPCGIQFKPEQEGNTSRGNQSENSVGDLSLALPGKKADLSTKGLFSRVFSKVRSLKSSEDGEQRPEDKSTVIVMGSLPLTNL